MKYLLFRQDEETSGPVIGQDCESEFAATEWARSWLQTHAEHDRYVLRSENDARAMLIIKTIAGQWYAMALSDEAARRPD